MSGDGEAPPSGLVRRWQQRADDELPENGRELRRVARETRRLIDGLVATSPSPDEVRHAAARLAEIADEIEAWPRGRTYSGFAESANAGAEVDPTFEHSPFLGMANPLSPPIRIEFGERRVTGTVVFGAAYEGPPSAVHGGYVAATFDELLGAAQCLSGRAGMTAHLEIDYRKPTPLGVELELEGWVDRVEGRKIYARGVCRADGVVTAEGLGLFIAVDLAIFEDLRRRRSEATAAE